MDDDKFAFPAQHLRAKALRARAPCATQDGKEEHFAEMSQHPPCVIVQRIRDISVTTCHIKERGDGRVQRSRSANDEHPMRENVYEEVNEPRKAENVVYQSTRSRTSKRKSIISKRFKIFAILAVFLSVVSLTISSYASYYTIIQSLDCNCTQRKVEAGTSLTVVNAITFERLKEILVTKIKKLKKQLQEIQSQTGIPVDKLCKKTPKECQKELITNLKARFSTVHKKMELLFKTSKRRMDNEMEFAKTRIQEKMNFTAFVEEKLVKMNRTFLTKLKRIQNKQKLQHPLCILKNETSSAIQSLVVVQVSKRSENFVTLGVTCSTSARNAPKTFYLHQPTTDDESYTCYCQNGDSNKKRIDCIAYYWQCRDS